MLFDFYARNQEPGAAEVLHFNATYRVREGERAAVRGYPIFVGLGVGIEGVALHFHTVNVKNDADEAFLDFLEGDVFKNGLKLATTAQPAIAPLAMRAVIADQLSALREALQSIRIVLQARDWRTEEMPGSLVEAMEHFSQAMENVADAVRQVKASVNDDRIVEKLDLIHTTLSDIGSVDVLTEVSSQEISNVIAKLNELIQAVRRVGHEVSTVAGSASNKQFHIPVMHMNFQAPAGPVSFLKWDSDLTRCEQLGKDILFSTGSAKIAGTKNEAALSSITEEILYKMQKYTEGEYILAIGHADGVGDVLSNLQLSEQRAEEVLEKIDKRIKLKRYGDREKLTSAVGRGEAFEAEEQSPTGANENNRRVEVWYCGGNGDPAQAEAPPQ